MTIAPGTRLGSYEIVSGIGAGGMGEVYRARDRQLDRFVAIKVLPESLAADPERVARFEREAKTLAALNHPNIAQIYGFESGSDVRALVLELVEGPTLDAMIASGPLPAGEIIRIATQIATALEAAHGSGIIHRDLKPANVKVRLDGMVKVLDLGLAKRLSQVTRSDDATLAIREVDLTSEGLVVGTPGYMSPEQAKGQPLDARSDIFSLGAVIYEMASGKRAFRGRSVADVLTSILRDHPDPLPPPIGTVTARCLAKSPDDRYQTMAEVLQALEGVAPKPRDDRPSIAVLPFANTSRDAGDEYFSDGLSEEIINALADISGLKVIARTSAFAFKGKNEDVRRIAESLDVSNILEGSVRRSGNRLRITVQLIHAADGAQLWSQRFDREVTDVFAVQDEISAAITAALRVQLGPDEAKKKRHEPDLRAHEAWLKGLHAYRIHEPAKFAETEHFFHDAIAFDPEWADPHSLLAERYVTMGMLGLRPVSEAIPLARSAAGRAIELRPADPTAHAALGAIAAVHDYDWARAAEEFRQAVSSDAAPPVVYSTYGLHYLLPLGRFGEALGAQDQSITLDPLNQWWRVRRMVILVCAGRYHDAIAEAGRSLAEGRGGHLEHVLIGQSNLQLGNEREAVDNLRQALRLAPWHAGTAGLLAGVLSRFDPQEAQSILASMRGGMIASGMVNYHLVRSEIDDALDWYERQIEERQPLAAQFAAAHFLSPLRSTDRWPRLARMMNLPSSLS